MVADLGEQNMAGETDRVLDDRSSPREGPDSVGRQGLSLYERGGKRALDVVGALVVLVVLLPVLLVISLVVQWSLGWPLFHNQPRVGRNGTHFKMFKFRTMLTDRRVSDVVHVGPERRLNHKCPDDPRHTPVGRVLRKSSLDELPQLLNVLRGDMSLVGPRPELIAIRDQLGSDTHERVRPGMTGPWQVYSRDSSDHERRRELDNGYVEQITLARDLKLLALTTLAVARRTGV